MNAHDPSTHPVALEVCIQSLDDAIHSAAHGAARVELNTAVDLGGLTPSIGLTESVVEALRPTGCQVIAMVRPRPGGFNYAANDLAVMQRDIDRLLTAGVDGVALGILDASGTIAIEANRTLIEPVLAAGRTAVFHRAFDIVSDKQHAIQTLIQLGFHRVLTSGGKPSAIDGAETIRQCITWADGKIEVLPGGGVTPDNVAELVRATGCNQVHASLRSLCDDGSIDRACDIEFNATPTQGSSYKAADAMRIEQMMQTLHAFGQ